MITLTGGPDSLKIALANYQKAWKAFIVINHFESIEPTWRPAAISWKVEHKVALYGNLRLIGDQAEQIHIGTINDRFIAMAVLKKKFADVRIIKLLERRPGSSDLLGLDSLDYYVEDLEGTYDLLKAAGARVEKQHNDWHEWLSLRFGKNHEYEAKFLDHPLLDIAIQELTDIRNSLSGR
jgi:hypothetical protein